MRFALGVELRLMVSSFVFADLSEAEISAIVIADVLDILLGDGLDLLLGYGRKRR